jgi:hypothetical protein
MSSGITATSLKITGAHTPVMVFDDFLDNPDEIRELALQQRYAQDKEGYPGIRSPREQCDGALKRFFERYIDKPILRLEFLFQFQPKEYEAKSFIHGDLCDWAAVLYLNKDCDGKPGTAFYRHKKTGLNTLPMGAELMFAAIEQKVQPDNILEPLNGDRFDPDKWDTRLVIPIRYNRLVLYNAKLFHRNASAWGETAENSRLVQGFFIHTEPANSSRMAGMDVLQNESQKT